MDIHGWMLMKEGPQLYLSIGKVEASGVFVRRDKTLKSTRAMLNGLS